MIELEKFPEVTELVLTREGADRTLFELPGVGLLRVGGYFGGAGATLTVDGVTWQCFRDATLSMRFAAKDASGRIVGRFERSRFRASTGKLEWAGRSYGLPAAALWTPEFKLTKDGALLAELKARPSGATPVTVRLHAPETPKAALLFAAYVAREIGKGSGGSSSGSGGDGGGFDGGSGGGDSSGCGGGGCGGGCGGGS